MRVGLILPYETDNPADSAESDLALAEITLASASDVLKIELDSADVVDLKSVGLATADVAVLTILIAAHKSVAQWWLPAGLMGASGVCFFTVLRSRYWEWGPDFKAFRRKNCRSRFWRCSLSESRQSSGKMSSWQMALALCPSRLKSAPASSAN